MGHSDEYQWVMVSKRWRDLRGIKSIAVGHKCEHCGDTKRQRELHHKHYNTLGNESLDDTELLCKSCHKIADEKRNGDVRQRGRRARYYAGLRTYASKKYGEDWEDSMDYEMVEEEFDEWLTALREWD